MVRMSVASLIILFSTLGTLGAPLDHAVAATTCGDLATDARRLDQEIADVGGPGPRLCLLFILSEDVYKGVVIGVDTPDQFRAAKADAVGQLAAAGFDLCRIATWEGQGRQALTLTAEDRLDLPIECHAHMIAADAGAQALLGQVQDEMTRIQEVTASQLGWRPNRSFTVRVFTDIDAAIPVFQRYLLRTFPNDTADHIAETTRSGAWATLPNSGDPGWGNLLLINLTRPAVRTIGAIKNYAALTYTAFATGGIRGSGSIAQWYTEGFSSYQAERNAGASSGYLALAAQLQRDGHAIPLAELTQTSDWTAHRLADGSVPVFARTHAAVIFLIDSYGLDPVVQLMRDDHDGSIAHFNDLLATLTGMDLAALNDSFGNWLLGVPAVLKGAGDTFHVEVTRAPRNSYGETVIVFDKVTACGGTRTIAAGTKVTFPLTINPDSSFTGTGYFGNAVVTVDGRPDGNGATGTMRLNNPTNGCDTGFLAYQAGG